MIRLAVLATKIILNIPIIALVKRSPVYFICSHLKVVSSDVFIVFQLERWFVDALKKKGNFSIKKMAEDGACLFRAVGTPSPLPHSLRLQPNWVTATPAL